MTDSHQDYKSEIQSLVLQDETFIKLTMSGHQHGTQCKWSKTSIRQIPIKGVMQYQFTYWDGKQSIIKNYKPEDAVTSFTQVLDLPFKQYHLQMTTGDILVQLSKKGKVQINRNSPSLQGSPEETPHNRVKSYPIPIDIPDDFLIAIDIMDDQGHIKPTMQAKYRQINEFIRHIDPYLTPPLTSEKSVRMVDCGCGSAYLTFAAYHYIKTYKEWDVHVTGIDHNTSLIEKCIKLRDRLGWDGLDFISSSIQDYKPESLPDMVLSLHACDTATDEAVAQGIKWDAKAIIAAPCCQSELRKQVQSDFQRPLLRHGLLKHRTADLITDSVRALLLRIMGYKTDVVEFVYPAHTPKNLMIRGQSGLKPGELAFIDEYKQLKAFWHIDPALERLIGDPLKSLLEGTQSDG